MATVNHALLNAARGRLSPGFNTSGIPMRHIRPTPAAQHPSYAQQYGAMQPRIAGYEQPHPEYYAAGGAVVGGLLGYLLGRRTGRPLLGAAAGAGLLGAGAYVVTA